MSDNVVARLREYLREVEPGQWDWSWPDEGDDAPDVHIERGGWVIAHNVLDVHHAVLVSNTINALPALLDVAEAFAASSPVADDADDTMPTCRYCGDKAYSDPDGVYGWDHADDCPWLAARELCGMDGDA